WFLHSTLRIPLTHDATRLLCIFHWLLAASLLGAAASKITRSTLPGIFVAAQSVVHLSAIAHEPAHPQQLVVVLVAAGLFCAARFALNQRGFGWLAVITALLAFTKINVG